MPRYLFQDGEIQTLSRRAAADVAAVVPLEEVDATGQPVLPVVSALAAEIEQFRTHEQVSLLQAALREAQARVREIEALLAQADAALTRETQDATARVAAAETAAGAEAGDADRDHTQGEV